MSVLTPRWTIMRPHPVQQAYWLSPHRFNTLPAGRRSGKTELAKRKLVKRLLRGTPFDRPRFFAGAPTRDQAKRIFWDDLKAMIPNEFLAGRPSESELIIKIITGAELHIIGLDKPERVEGNPWDGGVLDEFANMKEKAWQAHVRPALSDRRGWCDLIGVPEGRNHYYKLDKAARAQMVSEGAESLWGAFTWVSADILPPEEVEQARADLDPLTYAQEYEASFVNFEGRAYYVFEERLHCGRLTYDPLRPIAIMFDFNVDPGVAAICQEQTLPNGQQGTGIIGEVHIPLNSNTPAVCRRIVQDWGKHKGRVAVFGDATGGARGTAKTTGSDWDIIARELRPVFQERLTIDVPASNPPERVRLNAVNTRLKNGAGDVRMMVDAKRCPQVVNDFEGVRLLKGGSGEIDKKADRKLSHISDAIGYFVARMFPIHDGGGVRTGQTVGMY